MMKDLSRRTLLISVTGGAAAFAARASALEPSPVKVSKDSVHYRTVSLGDHRCGVCKLFIAPSSCSFVSGEISRDCGCRIWLPKAV